MGKFLILQIAGSATFISSLLFSFTNAGIAQEYPICFMVNSSEQVVNLENLCQSKAQREAIKKASICQGPFDHDGFPIAFSPDLERLQVAIAKAKKNLSNSKDSEKQSLMGVEDLEVKAAMEKLMNNIPSYNQLYQLQQQLQEVQEDYTKELESPHGLGVETVEIFPDGQFEDSPHETAADTYNQSVSSVHMEKVKKLEEQIQNIQEQMNKVSDELSTDPCNLKLMEAFSKKIAQQYIF